jgi:hypothetical protein
MLPEILLIYLLIGTILVGISVLLGVKEGKIKLELATVIAIFLCIIGWPVLVGSAIYRKAR